MSNATERLLKSVNPKKTRGQLTALADARTPAERQVENALSAVSALAERPAEGERPNNKLWKITVPVSEESRREFKKICLDRDTTIEAFVRDAINAHLRALGISGVVIR